MSFPRSSCVSLVWALPMVSALSCGAPRLIGGSGAVAESGATGNEGEDDAADDTLGPDTEGDDVDENACLPGIGDCPDDQKCMPYVTEPGSCCVDAAQCVPLEGDQKAGEYCTREQYSDDCERDAFCVGTEKCGVGVCLQMCDGSDPKSCANFGMLNATCVPHNDGVLPVCHTMCHPLRPKCEEGEACFHWVYGEQAYLCRPPDPEEGEGRDGDECESAWACNAGLQCWEGDGLERCKAERCCTPDCDLRGDGSECPAETETCVPVFDPDNLPHPMYEDVGVCGLAD